MKAAAQQEREPALPWPLPGPDDVLAFVESLNAARYRLDPFQAAAVEKLLLLAHMEEWSTFRFRGVAASILTKSAAQRFDFEERFDAWFKPPPVARPLNTIDRLLKALLQKRRQSLAIGAVMAIVLATVLITLWYRQAYRPPEIRHPPASQHIAVNNPGAPQPQIPESQNPKTPDIGSIVSLVFFLLAGVPVALFAVWLFVEWQRRRLWLSSGVLDRSQLLRPAARISPPLIFNRPALRGIARQLRRYRASGPLELDIVKTIQATARERGTFTPVYRNRLKQVECLTLIEQSSAHDHVARMFDGLVEQLKNDGVSIRRYHFGSDLRLLFADDKTQKATSLEMLSQTTRHTHILVVLGRIDGMFDQISGALVSGLGDILALWERRIVLNTAPVFSWGDKEQVLLEDGFSMADATLYGIEAFAQQATSSQSWRGLLLGGITAARTAAPNGLDFTQEAADKSPVLARDLRDGRHGTLSIQP